MTDDATGALLRRRSRRVLACCALVAAAVLAVVDVAPGAGAASARPGIDVLQVEGYLDAPNATAIRDAIADANHHRSTMLILQLTSNGAIEEKLDDVVRAIDRSRVPVVVWVGPSGSDAKGAAAVLVEAAHRAYVSPNSGVGPAHPLTLDQPDAVGARALGDRLAALAASRGRDPGGARRLATGRLGSAAAASAGATDGVEPTIGELIVNLDGQKVTTAAGVVKLSTAKVVGKGRARRREPNQEVRFRRLGLGAAVLHRLINPSIAYVLLVVGLALMVFEFFTAGIGIAGLVGALCVVGAFTGFSHLPVHLWALALLALSTFGFSVDVQVGVLGPWTVIGAAALGVGSVWLYGGSGHLRPAWWLLLLVGVGMVLFMLGGMTAMVRARFSTPTIGREGMIGEEGTAEVAVDPDGVVLIRGARWRARTNRATPIPAGDPARVVAVEGLVLEVEPLEGGAEDYRERARNRRRSQADAEPGLP